jgi:hypothetical protein
MAFLNLFYYLNSMVNAQKKVATTLENCGFYIRHNFTFKTKNMERLVEMQSKDEYEM